MRKYINLLFIIGSFLIFTGCNTSKQNITNIKKINNNPLLVKDKVKVKVSIGFGGTLSDEEILRKGIKDYMDSNFSRLMITKDLNYDLKIEVGTNGYTRKAFFGYDHFEHFEVLFGNYKRGFDISFYDDELGLSKGFNPANLSKSTYYNIGLTMGRALHKKFNNDPKKYNREIFSTSYYKKKLILKNSKEEYVKIMKIWPKVYYYRDIERKLYEKLLKENNIESYAKFLKDFPDSKHIKEIKSRMIYEEYKKAFYSQNLEEYYAFIKKYPYSSYVNSIENRIVLHTLIELHGSKDIYAYKTLLNKYPNSEYISEIRKEMQKLEYKEVIKTNNQEALKSHLEKYPDQIKNKELIEKIDEVEVGDLLEELGQ